MGQRQNLASAELRELAELLVAVPGERRGEILCEVLSFRAGRTLGDSLEVGVFRAAFANYWEAIIGGALPVSKLISILRPPIPIRTVMQLSRVGFAGDVTGIEDAVVELAGHLQERIVKEFPPTQLSLLEIEDACNTNIDRADLAVGGSVTTLDELISRGRKFSTVYADPPWQYANVASRAAADNHYTTMSLEEICAEPVQRLVAGDAHLHLWTTSGFLWQAFEVIRAWGFEYKSSFVWVKDEIGMGNYWRLSHEFLLLGVRGRLRFRDRTLQSWVQAKRTTHSRKPGEIRTLIERASPGPYLEMYGREELRDSEWTVYGNQIERRLF